MTFWEGRTVLITGGTGSFGRAFARRILREPVRSLRILSRDELKQSEMAKDFTDPRIRFLIGDVRDADRLMMAFNGVGIVIHAAAMKRIDAAEKAPLEAVKTNVHGAENVIRAALERQVERVVALSSDKACIPTTLYGSTKMLAERLFSQANIYAGSGRTRFANTRYGNVCGSRGSLVPLLLEQRKTGIVTLTDPRMTRFHMRMSEAVELVKWTAENMEGGETVIPKLPSVRVVDVIEAVAPGCEVRMIGLRTVEKLHESLVAYDESRCVETIGDRYVIRPGSFLDAPSFEFRSDTNDKWLTVEEIRDQIPSALEEAA